MKITLNNSFSLKGVSQAVLSKLRSVGPILDGLVQWLYDGTNAENEVNDNLAIIVPKPKYENTSILGGSAASNSSNVAFAFSTPILTSTSWTVSFYVGDATITSVSHGIFGRTVPTDYARAYINTVNQLIFIDNTNTSHTLNSNVLNFTDSVWTITSNGTNVYFYVDGTLSGTVTPASTLLTLENICGYSSVPFLLPIGDFGIWSAFTSDGTLDTIANALGYYPLNEGAGYNAFDISGNQNTAMLRDPDLSILNKYRSGKSLIKYSRNIDKGFSVDAALLDTVSYFGESTSFIEYPNDFSAYSNVTMSFNIDIVQVTNGVILGSKSGATHSVRFESGSAVAAFFNLGTPSVLVDGVSLSGTTRGDLYTAMSACPCRMVISGLDFTGVTEATTFMRYGNGASTTDGILRDLEIELTSSGTPDNSYTGAEDTAWADQTGSANMINITDITYINNPAQEHIPVDENGVLADGFGDPITNIGGYVHNGDRATLSQQQNESVQVGNFDSSKATYVDTNRQLPLTGDFVFEAHTSGYGEIMTQYISGNSGRLILYSGGNPRLFFDGGTRISGTTTLRTYTIKLTRTSGTFEIFINGVSFGTHVSATAISNHNTWLGARNNAIAYFGYIYDVTVDTSFYPIDDGSGTTVVDSNAISNGTVSGDSTYFWANEELSPGPISEYPLWCNSALTTPVNNLSNCIDVGISLGENYVVEYRGVFDVDWGSLGQLGDAFFALVSISSGATWLYGTASITVPGIHSNEVRTFKFSKDGLFIDGEFIIAAPVPGVWGSGTANFHVVGSSSTTTSKFNKMEWCKIWDSDGGTLVRHLIPERTADTLNGGVVRDLVGDVAYFPRSATYNPIYVADFVTTYDDLIDHVDYEDEVLITTTTIGGVKHVNGAYTYEQV